MDDLTSRPYFKKERKRERRTVAAVCGRMLSKPPPVQPVISPPILNSTPDFPSCHPLPRGIYVEHHRPQASTAATPATRASMPPWIAMPVGAAAPPVTTELGAAVPVVEREAVLVAERETVLRVVAVEGRP